MPTLDQLEKLLAVDPGDAFVLYGLAQEHAKRGDTAKAVEFYDKCLAVDPAYCYASFHKAKTLHEAGRTTQAAEVLREGLSRARAIGDAHAASEISGFLDEVT